MSRVDEGIAKRKTKAAAAQAPLLALGGLTPTFTAEGVAEKRDTTRSRFEHAEARNTRRTLREITAAQVDVLLYGGHGLYLQLLPFEKHHLEASTYRWYHWRTAARCVRSGEPIPCLQPLASEEALGRSKTPCEAEHVISALTADPAKVFTSDELEAAISRIVGATCSKPLDFMAYLLARAKARELGKMQVHIEKMRGEMRIGFQAAP